MGRCVCLIAGPTRFAWFFVQVDFFCFYGVERGWASLSRKKEHKLVQPEWGGVDGVVEPVCINY
jgi:hypothetical protein